MRMPRKHSAVIAIPATTPVATLVATPAATLQPGQSTGFNPAINGFRGVCVLLVFAYHVANSGLLPEPEMQTSITRALTFFAASWRYGVELFFMISGYVIIASLRRHRSVAAFLRDRCLRIFPVWVPVHLTIFCIGTLVGWKIFYGLGVAQMWLVFVSNLFLVPPLLPLPVLHPASWSLSYEWLFYLLAAAAFALHARRNPATYPHDALWLLWGAVTVWLLCWLPRALFFVPGVILALGWLPLDKLRPWLRLPWLSLLVFLLAWRMVDLDQAHPAAYSVASILGSSKLLYVMLAFLAGLHLFACICRDNGANRWLQRADIQLLGTVSYSFYLWHPIVMFAVKKPVLMLLMPTVGSTLSVVVFATVSFAVAVPLSWLSYRWFEQGLAKLLRNWFKPRQSPVAPVAPMAAAAATTLPLSAESSSS